ncbi:hypothetical protein BDV11DRAFT_212893 [Aspergillus similis]
MQLQPDGTLAKNGPEIFMVTEKSATSLGLTATHEEDNISLSTDHSGLVKYESRSHDDYSIVKKRLKTLVTEAKQKVRERFEEKFTNEDQQCLKSLLLSNPESDRRRIEKTKGGLLDDSFRWIMDTAQYQAWLNNPGSQLLWIKGDAGKGKTMLMIGIVEELLKLGLSKSPAYFFCQGTDLKLNNATAVLRGLIYMLITQQRHLILYLRQKYDIEGQSLFKGPNAFYSLSAIFETMIEQVQPSPVHLLVDALDECQVDLKNLLKFIKKTIYMSSAQVKWLASSRSMGYYEQILTSCQGVKQLSLELNAGHISQAIESYINHKVMGLQFLQADEEVLKLVRDQLSRKSDGTFLWVALVVEGLQKCVFEEEILDALEAIPEDLIGVYKKMIGQLDALGHRSRDICLTVLSMAVLAYRPLHVSEMRHLTGRHKEKVVESAVGLCGSFLTIRDEYIYLIHQSAKDFLDSDDATSILPKHSEIHNKMYSQSRETLSAKLKRDIYGLNNPGILVSEIAARRPDSDPLFDLRYSCTYWLDHLLKSMAPETPELLDNKVPDFFKQHLLHWLESLGLTGELRHGILSLKKLSARQSQYQPIFKEAERFASANAVIIQEAPLQIYSAALVFCPRESTSKRTYWDQRFNFIKQVYVRQEFWDPCIQVLEGHKDTVSAVAFSPDGQIVASASFDGTILKGNDDMVSVMAFSPDGQIVASASADRTIRLWDAATGAEKQIHYSDVISWNLWFSADGSYFKSPYSLNSPIFVHEKWVARNGQRLIWLPPQYRATCVLAGENTVILGHQSGALTFLYLN